MSSPILQYEKKKKLKPMMQCALRQIAGTSRTVNIFENSEMNFFFLKF